jgi:hypothetical protein
MSRVVAVRMTFDRSDPGSSSKFKTLLYLPGCAADQSLTITLTADFPGSVLDNDGNSCAVPPPPSVSKTFALNPLKICE